MLSRKSKIPWKCPWRDNLTEKRENVTRADPGHRPRARILDIEPGEDSVRKLLKKELIHRPGRKCSFIYVFCVVKCGQ